MRYMYKAPKAYRTDIFFTDIQMSDEQCKEHGCYLAGMLKDRQFISAEQIESWKQTRKDQW